MPATSSSSSASAGDQAALPQGTLFQLQTPLVTAKMSGKPSHEVTSRISAFAVLQRSEAHRLLPGLSLGVLASGVTSSLAVPSIPPAAPVPGSAPAPAAGMARLPPGWLRPGLAAGPLQAEEANGASCGGGSAGRVPAAMLHAAAGKLPGSGEANHCTGKPTAMLCMPSAAAGAAGLAGGGLAGACWQTAGLTAPGAANAACCTDPTADQACSLRACGLCGCVLPIAAAPRLSTCTAEGAVAPACAPLFGDMSLCGKSEGIRQVSNLLASASWS